MACGVPVISSDSGSLPEVVGDAGCIVPEHDSESLAVAILDLKQNQHKRLSLSTRGIQRVGKFYTWSRVAQLIG